MKAMPQKLLIIIVVLLTLIVADDNRDFYKILDIKRSATEREIKKAFKAKSLKYHPDKNKDDPENALKMFQDVSAAYEVLSDQDKRRKYDQCGEKCANEPERQQGHNPFGGIFGDFFGGGFG
jgi:DnaJ family protein B protein 11